MSTDTPAPLELQHAYPQVARLVFQRPWAILAETFDVVADLTRRRISGQMLSAEEIQERLAAAPPRPGARRAGKVAVIPLAGVIMPKANLFTQVSGATSAEGFAAEIRRAAADDSVSEILIEIDSPGGSVDLIPEAAQAVRDARARKPVTAIANTLAASAAYWIGSQATELVVTPSGMVGSIGVFCAHDDVSGLQEKMGVKTTLISAGKYKVEGNPYEPLSDEGRGALERVVGEIYDMFVEDVAAGRRTGSRRTTAKQVREGFGEGRVVTAQRALAEGMVDRIETFDQTLARLVGGGDSRRLEQRALAEQAAHVEVAASLREGLDAGLAEIAEHARRLKSDHEEGTDEAHSDARKRRARRLRARASAAAATTKLERSK